MKVILAIALLPLQFGLHMALLNAPMEYIGCDGVEGQYQDCVVDWWPAFVSSSFAIGGLIGSACGSFLTKTAIERISSVRRYTRLCVIAAGFYVAGSLCMVLMRNFWLFTLGRVWAGGAAGFTIVGAPIVISRIAAPHQRGMCGALTQIATNGGIIIAQLLGLVWAETHWRRIIDAGFVISLVGLAGVLYAAHTIADPEYVDTEEEDEAESTSLSTFFTEKRYRYALITTLSIFIVQQLTGINSIIQYGVMIMEQAVPDHAKGVNVGLSVVNLVVTLMSAPLLDKYGRKLLLLVSLGSMGCCTAILAFGLVRGLAGFSVLAVFATISAFAIGIGPIPFLYVSEVTPPEALGVAQSVGTSASWLATFFVLALFPMLKHSMGASVFYVFSLATLAAAAFYAWFLHS